MVETERIQGPASDPDVRRVKVAALLGDRRANDDARRLLITSAALGAIVGLVYGTSLQVGG